MNDAKYSRRADAALILGPDPLATALLGAAVELVGFRASFPQKGETLKAAVRRVRPSHVLIDADDLRARDETELGPTIMTGARLFFFGSAKRVDHIHDLAARFGARILVLPEDLAELSTMMHRPPAPTRTPRVSD